MARERKTTINFPMSFPSVKLEDCLPKKECGYGVPI
jgi:hypothetical protein